MNLAVPNNIHRAVSYLCITREVPLEAQLYVTSSARGRTTTMIGNGESSCHVLFRCFFAPSPWSRDVLAILSGLRPHRRRRCQRRSLAHCSAPHPSRLAGSLESSTSRFHPETSRST